MQSPLLRPLQPTRERVEDEAYARDVLAVVSVQLVLLSLMVLGLWAALNG